MIINNTSLSNLSADRGLYRVWIRAHEGANAPVVSVWIDPQMRAFEPGAEMSRHEPVWTESPSLEGDAGVREEDEGHQRTEIARPASLLAVSHVYGQVLDCV